MNYFRKILGFVFVFCLVSTSWGQLKEQAYVGLPDEADIIKFSDSSLGFLPARRVRFVTSSTDRSSSIAKLAEVASLESGISSTEQGVIYNYSMQAYGLVSGEITFAVRAGVNAKSLDWRLTAPPRALGPPNVFVVNVGTGTELLRVMDMLASDPRVSWVEPSVRYISEAIE